jgi:hypothetical protein
MLTKEDAKTLRTFSKMGITEAEYVKIVGHVLSSKRFGAGSWKRGLVGKIVRILYISSNNDFMTIKDASCRYDLRFVIEELELTKNFMDITVKDEVVQKPAKYEFNKSEVKNIFTKRIE